MSQQQQEVNMREVIEGWKEKSKKTFALEQLKRMISEVNKKPTDYHPSDFFPKLPSSYTATSSSDEPTIENIRNISKRRLEYSQASTSTTKNLNISVSKLNTDKENQPAPIPSSQINITRCIVEEAEHEMLKSPFKPSNKTRRSTAGPLSSKENITPLMASPIVVEKLKRAENKTSEISIVNEIADDNYELEEEFEELKQPKSSTLLDKIRNKMSSTSNNLEVSIQQSRTPLGKLKSVSSTKNPFSPAKEAFNNSIKRKSNNLSLLTEAPFDLENDEVVVGSGELYQASISSNQTQSRNEPKPKSKSSIKITKISKPVEVASQTLAKSQSTASLSQPTVNEPIKDINVDLGLSKKLKSSASASTLTNKQKVNLNQPENDSKDEQELLEQQTNKFIRRSLMKSSTLSLTTNTTVNTSSAPANQPSSHIFKSSRQLAKLSQVPPVPLFPTKKSKAKPSEENVQVEVFADNAEPEVVVVKAKKTSKNALKEIGNERETRQTRRSRESPIKRTRSSAVSRAPVSATSNKENIKQKPAKSKKQAQVVCEEEESGPRRSKRARHDPTCVAVYDYVPVIDFNGVQTLCLQMVGTKPRTSLFRKGIRELYYNIKPKKNKKERPKALNRKKSTREHRTKRQPKRSELKSLKKLNPAKKRRKRKASSRLETSQASTKTFKPSQYQKCMNMYQSLKTARATKSTRSEDRARLARLMIRSILVM